MRRDILKSYIKRTFLKKVNDMGSMPQLQPADCFEFTWRRRVKGPGYRWIVGKRGQEILVEPPDGTFSTYEPLKEETGLFLSFARLDGSREQFVRFANIYGRLGTYHSYHPENGEPFYEWERVHRWMRFLAKLQSECTKARPRLGQTVTWNQDDVIFHFPKIDSSTETWRQRGYVRKRLQNRQGLPLFKPGDRIGPARWFLCYALEQWLRELDGLGKPIAARMVWSEDEEGPRFVFSASNLIGAMVYQFAASVHGRWPFKECAYCHDFFRLAPGVNKKNRLTCSRTCKQYLHNARVIKARKLHDAGGSVRQIAEKLNVKPQRGKSSADIVRSWIAKG
jgi:hypothetical protein